MRVGSVVILQGGLVQVILSALEDLLFHGERRSNVLWLGLQLKMNIEQWLALFVRLYGFVGSYVILMQDKKGLLFYFVTTMQLDTLSPTRCIMNTLSMSKWTATLFENG